MRDVFGNENSFSQATKDAFTFIVNTDMGKFGVMHLLAAYCDNLLKV